MILKEHIIKTTTANFDIRIWREFSDTYQTNDELLNFVKTYWKCEDGEELAEAILNQSHVNAVEVVPNWFKHNAVAVGCVFYKDWP
jgi:hypothetical protein